MTTIHWRNGDISTWNPTYLSYADGMLYEYDHLCTNEMETLGVRLSRGFHSSDPSIATPYIIAEEKVIIAPEELGSVLAVMHSGMVKLLYDPKTGKLSDVLLPQIEALVYGNVESKEPIAEPDMQIGKTEESLDDIELGTEL